MTMKWGCCQAVSDYEMIVFIEQTTSQVIKNSGAIKWKGLGLIRSWMFSGCELATAPHVICGVLHGAVWPTDPLFCFLLSSTLLLLVDRMINPLTLTFPRYRCPSLQAEKESVQSNAYDIRTLSGPIVQHPRPS